MEKLKNWSTSMRKNLEYLLKAGFSLQDICEKMVISRTALTAELKRGVSPDDFAGKRYVPYSASLATFTLAVRDLDDEGVELLRKYINGKK